MRLLLLVVLLSAEALLAPSLLRRACGTRLRAENNQVIFVTNLDYRTSPVELRAAFESAGPVAAVSVPRDAKTGRGRGYALIEVEDTVDVAAVVEAMQARRLSGRVLNVTLDKFGDRKAAVATNERIKNAAGARDVLDNVDADWTPVNVATALHRLGRERLEDSPELATLIDAAASHIRRGDMNARCLANACWGVARLRGTAADGAFFDAVAEAAPAAVRGMKAEELAQVAWALGARRRYEAMDAVAEAATAQIGTLGAAALATVAQALARQPRPASDRTRAFFQALARTDLPAALEGMEDQRALVATAASLARTHPGPPPASSAAWGDDDDDDEHEADDDAGLLDRRAWDKALEHIASRVDAAALTTEALAAAATALSVVVRPSNVTEGALAAVAASAAGRIGDLSAQSMASLASAVARRSVVDADLFAKIAAEVEARPESVAPRHLAEIAAAFARVRVRAPALIRGLASSHATMDQWTPTEVAVAAESVAFVVGGGGGAALLASSESGDLLPLFFEATKRRVLEDTGGAFDAASLARVASALAVAGVADGAVCAAVARRFKNDQSEDPESSSSSSSSSAQGGAGLLGAAPRDGDNHLDRLHDLVLALGEGALGDDALAARSKAAWLTRDGRRRASLRKDRSFQRLEATVDLIRWPSVAHETEEGVALELAQPDAKLAVTVDGPSRCVVDLDGEAAARLAASTLVKRRKSTAFQRRVLQRLGWRRLAVTGAPQHLDGPTALAARALDRRGFKVARVPSAEFDRLRTAEDRAAFVLERMEAAFGQDVVLDDS